MTRGCDREIAGRRPMAGGCDREIAGQIRNGGKGLIGKNGGLGTELEGLRSGDCGSNPQ